MSGMFGEGKVRAVRRAEEAILVAQLEAAEAAKKRKEEYLRRVCDIDAIKIRIGDCTVRIGRNSERVSLKIHGYASDEVFLATKTLAHEHRGRFNPRARSWEFYRSTETESFFEKICETAQHRLVTSFWAPKDTWSPEICRVPTSSTLECPLPVLFDEPALQEVFDERAAILEFDAGYERQLAEQLAYSDVRAQWASQ